MATSWVRGFAVHWPGTTVPIGDPSRTSVARRLEAYRRYHVGVKGWSDIAYQAAVDAAGRVWDCRGITWRSAANGSAEDNRDFGALLLLVGPGDRPTSAMVEAVRDWRARVWLDTYPAASRVVGHLDIRDTPTDCPGPLVESLVTSGAFTRQPTPQPRPRPAKPTPTEAIMRDLPVLRRGDNGEDVQTLQGVLQARSHPEVRMDGDFGEITEDAVRAVQRWGGIRRDGVVGPDTWRVLLLRERG